MPTGVARNAPVVPCAHCGREIVRSQARRRFCSPACRLDHWITERANAQMRQVLSRWLAELGPPLDPPVSPSQILE